MLLYPRYSPPPPAETSAQGKALMGETESELQKLYIVARLRNKAGFYETRESTALPIGLWGDEDESWMGAWRWGADILAERLCTCEGQGG